MLNNTRVIPARLLGTRSATGGRWEGLYLDSPDRLTPAVDDLKRWVEDQGSGGKGNETLQIILEALAKTGGKIYGPDGAAALLGFKPTTLSSRIHRMGLKKF